MLNGKKIVVIMPAYNAERTLEKTYREISFEIVDDVILVDDASQDRTPEIAREMGIHTVVHIENLGYGANQKTCYRTALGLRADIVIMLHPDYQYTPRLVPAMASMIAYGEFDAVLASRILGIGALKGACPFTSIWRTVFSPYSRTFSPVTSCPNTTPATGPSHGRYWRNCHWRKIRMILFSTIKCSLSLFGSAIVSAKLAVQRSIRMIRHR